jgi:hypothetical protein
MKQKLIQDLYSIYGLKLSSIRYPTNTKYKMIEDLLTEVGNITHCNIDIVHVKYDEFCYRLENESITFEEFDAMCKTYIDFGELN